MQRPPFLAGNIYHVYNRGVDKRTVFGDDRDRFRFIHDLFEFNSQNPAPKFLTTDQHPEASEVGPPPRKLLVELLAFVLMDNHYHLLVKLLKDKSLSEFMQKIGTGYTLYFNQKHRRSGALFQGKYKVVLVKNTEHLLWLSYYIHLNPLDIITSGWRNGMVDDHKLAEEFLKNYRWSSFLDYIGKKNFPSVTQRKFVNMLLGDPGEYKRGVFKWLKEANIGKINHLLIEKT